MGLASFAALRTGLADNLAAISGLRVYPNVPDVIQTPAAIIAPGPVTFYTFDTTFARGSDDLTFVITLFVSRQWDRTSQNQLDSYLDGSGSQSVKQAAESDKTLGGACMSMAVESARNYGQFVYNNVEYYGCEFVVSIYA